MAPASRSNPLIAHGTHVGNVKPLNEDFYGIKSFRTVDGDWATVAVVGDGSGGYRAGDLTSKLAVEAITDFIEKSNGRNYLKLLEYAANEAGRQIFERTRSIRDHRVGTTCAVSLVIDGCVYIVYIGNSRVYLIGKRWGIRQASIDGTVLQALIEKGLLTQEEALQHPRHYYGLSLLVGYETADVDTKPDFRLRLDANETREQSEGNQGLLLAPGDAVLLCSDGLWAAVEEDELNAVITRASAPQLAVDELIALALQRGVPDNITAVILQVPSAP